jgi:hypothetical protein
MKKGLYLLGAAALTALLYACGGGSGSSSSPGTSTSSATGVSGTVTGFASLVVDGVEYDASKATVSKEVDPSSPATGMTTADVQIGHHIDCDDNGGMLGACVIRPRVIGPIATITPVTSTTTANQFSVLGQTIDVSNSTTYGGGYTGFSSLMTGDTVEVHGTLNADGSIQATRVEKEMQSTPVYLVVGLVSGATSGSFMINGLTVTYDSTTRLVPPSATIANGQTVTVFGTKPPAVMGSTITLAAAAIRVHFPGSLAGKTIVVGGRARELVTDSMGNLTAFEVDELNVDTTSGSLTVVTDGKPGSTKDITAGVRVLVLGTVNSGGTLVASEIWVRTTAEALLAGLITGVDTTAQTFTVRHTTVDYSHLAPAQIINGTTADIKAGAFVVVTGTPSATGVTADSLIFTPIPLNFLVGLPPIDLPPGWVGIMPPNPMLPTTPVTAYGGTVSNVASTGANTGSFTLTDRAGRTVTINETSATTYEPAGKTIANVVNASVVLVLGALNSGGSVDAAVVVILR